MAHYLEVVAGRTGALIAGAARIGALVAGADRATVRAAGAFGERIGTAFQITDDILDITGTAAGSGRRPPAPICAPGVHILPLLILRGTEPDSGDPTDVRLAPCSRAVSTATTWSTRR